jgi:type I restriction-modification system DNA methylase subunit
MTYTHTEAVNFIWSVADIIRDAGYHQSDYGDLMLPFVVLRRLDQAAADTRDKAVETADKLRWRGIDGEMLDQAITHAVGRPEVCLSECNDWQEFHAASLGGQGVWLSRRFRWYASRVCRARAMPSRRAARMASPRPSCSSLGVTYPMPA